MIKLTQITETFGDCTAGYSVDMDKQYTVKEFMAEVLTRKEWGSIRIFNKTLSWFENGDPHCEYDKDKLINEFDTEILDKIVIKATARGGWSNMDYILHV